MEKKEESVKKKLKKTKEKKQEKSNELLTQLNFIINDVKKTLSEVPKFDVVQKSVEDMVEGFFYGKLITGFKNNLNKHNQEELNISDKDVKNIERRFNDIFKRCDKTLKSGYNAGKIDLKEYQSFKKELEKISKNSYKLLLEVEKYIDIKSCKKSITKFKEEVKNLGKELKIKKELKIGDVESKDGSVSIVNVSIGFEGDD